MATTRGDGPCRQLIPGGLRTVPGGANGGAGWRSSDVHASECSDGLRGRTRAALAVKKARGERTGGVPMGRRVEQGRLVVDGGETAAVARACELRGEGKSLRAIATALAVEGHRPRGVRWHVQTLARMVTG